MKFIRKIFKKIAAITLQPAVRYYLSKPRKVKFEDVELIIPSGVFHPSFFFSTTFLLNYLKSIPLKEHSFLELGAGNALISFYANKSGAKVTATDISILAVDSIRANLKRNKVLFEVIQSDLFDKIPPQRFDIISINPPYYKKDPIQDADYAWYCGKNSEYFVKLFANLIHFIKPESFVIMVLSEDCDINEIASIAKANQFELTELQSKRIWLEKNYLFKVAVKLNEQ
jgi:release factor glutamine methyltransferase